MGGLGWVGYEGGGGRLSCPLPSPSAHSTIDNCKAGDRLRLSLQGCSVPAAAAETTFDCLGTWAGPIPAHRYFALYNREAKEFRCGVFQEEVGEDGEVWVHASLSNDSTCHHQLASPKDGYERFTIQKLHPPPWPLQEDETCEFPQELLGDWELVTVRADLLSYFQHHDPTTMSTLYAKCVRRHDNVVQILTRNHCGESGGYSCLRFARRSASVLEIQMGTVNRAHFDARQCTQDSVFDNSYWTTIARRDAVAEKCALSGELESGEGTSAGHCFSLTASCPSSHNFTFQGYACAGRQVFQSDTYDCLGSWEEGDRQYAYVRRQQDKVLGCFAWERGRSGRVGLAWTGKDCDRHVPLSAGDEEEAVEGSVVPAALPTLVRLQTKRRCPRANAPMRTMSSREEAPIDAPVLRARQAKEGRPTPSRPLAVGEPPQLEAFVNGAWSILPSLFLLFLAAL